MKRMSIVVVALCLLVFTAGAYVEVQPPDNARCTVSSWPSNNFGGCASTDYGERCIPNWDAPECNGAVVFPQ